MFSITSALVVTGNSSVECQIMCFSVSLEKMNKTKNKIKPLKQKFFIDGWLSEPVCKVWLVEDKDNT